MTARLKGALAALAAIAAIAGALLLAGVFSGDEQRAPTSFERGPGVGIPGLDALGDLAGGVSVGAVPKLRSRGGMETIMQDDAAFLYAPSDEALQKSMERVKQLGVDRIRLTAGWSVLAPEADADQKPSFDAADPDAYTRNGWKNYDPIGHWQALDRAVRATVAAGMEPMIDIGFWAPKWATSGDPRPIRRTFNVNAQEYGEFVKAVVKRYSGTYVPKYGAPPPPEQTRSGDSDLLQSIFGPGRGGSPSAGAARSSPGFPLDLLDSSSGGSGGSGGSDGSAGSDDGSGASTPPKPSGPPLPKVSLWTIWNEPNHAGFIQPQWRRQGARLVPNGPYVYRALVDVAYPIIKGLQPDSKVLVGATSSMGNMKPKNETDGMAPLQFVRALACVDAKLRPIRSGPCANYKPLQGDGYSHHPYSLLHTPDWSDKRHTDYAMMGDLHRLTNLLNRLVAMRRIDPKIRDVWLTEYGYESNPPDPIKPFSPTEQAQHINWAEYLAWKNPQVKSFPQFLLTDMGKVSAADAARGKREYGDWQSGLYFNDGTPKPAATSFPLALHVDCTTSLTSNRRKLLVIWGHVRPGSGTRQVRIEAAAKTAAAAAFRPAATAATLTRGVVGAAASVPVATDASGYFLRFAPYARGRSYRITVDGIGTGVAKPPDSCSGVTKQKRVRGAGSKEF